MRVFVTGASGWVGSAVTRELIANGHTVLGLARSDERAREVAALGAEVHRGSLEDLDSLKAGAQQAEGVIHTAFNHDFSKFAQNGEDEKNAIAALGEALAGTGKPLIVTSGTGLLTPGQLVTEDTNNFGGHVPRAPEAAVFAWTDKGVRTSVVRLPPSTHGAGDKGFLATVVGIARQKGFSAYIGDGQNHWPGVHRLDAAKVYVRALEKGRAGGVYHAVAEQGVPYRELAEAIGKGLGLPVKSIGADEVEQHFGWFARFAAINNLASSERTRAELGWMPTGPTLLEDLRSGVYFGS